MTIIDRINKALTAFYMDNNKMVRTIALSYDLYKELESFKRNIDCICYKYNPVSRKTDLYFKGFKVTRMYTWRNTIKIIPTSVYRLYDIKNILNEQYGLSCNGFEIKDVKFNGPATIVFWQDGTKTVVKCSEGDTFDQEKGLAMAMIKKMNGNDNTYHKIFKKWCKEEEEAPIFPFTFLNESLGKLSFGFDCSSENKKVETRKSTIDLEESLEKVAEEFRKGLNRKAS